MFWPCVLVLGIAVAQSGAQTVNLEIRVFDGSADVTEQTRVTIHRAGERGQPIAKVNAGEPRKPVAVPPGIYDAQAVHERDGRVLNLRWAERLVVMPYPDEGGHHLEVINLVPGYGALQVLPSPSAAVEIGLFGAGERARPLPATTGRGYTLYVVPAGAYDVQVRRGGRTAWHTGVDVPPDRTRLWLVPEPSR